MTSKPINKTCSLCGETKPNKGFHGNRCGTCRKKIWEQNAEKRGDSRELLIQRHKRIRLGGTDYEELLSSQGGVCAICRNPETQRHQNGQIKALAIDHCHQTGKNRGLLCSWCNVALGYFKDSPEALKSALVYLARHS